MEAETVELLCRRNGELLSPRRRAHPIPGARNLLRIYDIGCFSGHIVRLCFLQPLGLSSHASFPRRV
ncbi:hypothetical protein [Nocardia sp. R7R-8]|uniref:hypothetical protein n=1 Tax=Nocardia sp. R7R-8 TaxID=3459304 RepID=UPI00403DD60B